MKNEDSDFGERLRILEEKFAYQEYTIEQLNDVIISQQQQLDELEEKYLRLKDTIKAKTAELDAAIDNPRPPHY